MTPLPKTFQEAMRQGLKMYQPETPCAKGHRSPRYVGGGACVECVRGYNKKVAERWREYREGRADVPPLRFIYPLHPADHAAAKAFCQALDLQRGRPPRP